MNVGFYYMANAGGRLAGTLLSGWIYRQQGLEGCLWGSAILVLCASIASLFFRMTIRIAINGGHHLTRFLKCHPITTKK